MFGIFSILNSLVSVIFPIFGSYKSIESYNKVANEVELSKSNIGGFQAPINALLRKSGDSTNGIENSEESLQIHLISIQKWIVYWIVYASLNVVESVFLLRYIIPMYSFLRLGISVWLVSPMIIGLGGDTTGGHNIISCKSEFIQFLRSGCGLCYYRFIKPWLDGEFKLIGGIDLSKIISPSILEYLNQYEMIHYVTSHLNLNNPCERSHSESNFFDLVKSKVMDSNGSFFFVNTFFSYKTTSESPETKDVPLDANTLNGLIGAEPTTVNALYEEYDVVDKPGIQESVGNFKSEPKVEKRKGWIW